MADLYLALTDGTTTVTLSDQTKYILQENDGFVPVVPDEIDGYYPDVVDTITVHITGASPSVVLRNLRALTQMLEKAQRHADRETEIPVLLLYTVPGSSPGKILAAMITGWDRAGYLPANFNQRVQKNFVEGVQITLKHKAPWLLYAYTYPNLLSASSPMTGWTGTPVAISTQALIGAYGGTGKIQFTSTGASETLYSAGIPVVNGTTYTIRCTYAASATVATPGTIFFRNAARSALISSPTTFAIVPNTTIESGTTFTATLTATSSDSAAHLEVVIVSSTGAVFQLAEVLVTEGSGIDDTWHPTYAEVTTATTNGFTTHPEPTAATWLAETEYPSPTSISLTSFDEVDTPAISAGHLLIYPVIDRGAGGAQNYALKDFPATNTKTTAPFATNASEAATKYPYGGSFTRYTPASTSKISCHTAADFIDSSLVTFYGGIAAFAMVRNNSSTTTFQLSVGYGSQADTVLVETTQVPVDTSSVSPRLISLGEVYTDTIKYFQLYVQANAASGTLDIDYIVFLYLQSGASIVKYDGFLTSSCSSFDILARPLTHREPALGGMDGNTLTIPAKPTGSSTDIPLMTQTQSIGCLWIAPTSTFWTHVNTGDGNSVTTLALTATRIPAYVVPE